MKNFQKTAIALGVAQIALMHSGNAWAQQADAGPTATVVVTGQRAALQSAQKLKQNADEIVDSVVAEDIGKLPERSVTEVLQRVVGVTMDRSMPGDPQHSAVEGSGIAIRGLTYVRSELNGRESFSASGGRSLSFADVPPELMAGVDVYKNPSAEQTEGGISGLVNLRTAMPFDFKGLKGSATLQSSYSTLREGKATPSGSVLLSNRWTTPIGEIGALIDIASSESHTRTDSLALDAFYPLDNIAGEQGRRWVPRTAQWRSMNWERDRKGGYAALQWRPIRALTASLTYFKSKYDEGWSERVLQPSFGDGDPHRLEVTDGQFDSQGVFQKGTMYLRDTGGNRTGLPFAAERRVSQRNSSTADTNLNIQWRASDALTLRTDFQRVKADTVGFDSTVADGFLLPSQSLDLTGKYPRLIFSEADYAYLKDPANYYWVHMMEHKDKADSEAKAWRLDAKYDFDHPVLRDLRVGVRLTDRESINNTTVPSYNWSGITPAWMRGWRIGDSARLTDARFPLGKETGSYAFPNFFNGDVGVPSVIFPNDSVAMNYPDAYNELHGYYMQLCREQNGPTGDCPRTFNQAGWLNDPAGRNLQSEKTKAFYTQLRFAFDDWRWPVDGNLGVRYVKTDGTAHGYTVYRPNPLSFGDRTVVGAELVPNIPNYEGPQDFENSYSKLLPTLNLRLKYSDTLQFRMALGRSMARPDFGQLQANTTLSRTLNQSTSDVTNTTTITGVTLRGDSPGNPNLRPTMANSLDLTAEWYFRPGSSLTGALFYKKLKDIIVSRNYNFPLQDVNGNTHQFLVTGPVNGANGYARGAEIAFQHYFENLPSWAQGLGMQTSFTFVDSKRELKDPVFSEWCSGAQGADNFNIAINGCDTDGRSFGNLPLQGLSRRTINFSLMYDQGPWSARAAYNWRSRYLLGVNNFGTRGADARDTNPNSPTFGATNLAWGLPLWMKAYGQLDAALFYKVSDKLRIGLEAQNLNDAESVQEQQQHIGNMGRAWFVTGPRYTIQAQYSF